MSLLRKVIAAAHCRSTHHHLALDALRFLRGNPRWPDLFLKHHGRYLAGAKAPDDQFKDFKNHVLHVGDNLWGGAPEATRLWYGRTVHLLAHQDWAEAAFAAGVLSHYFTDPFMPLHTGQSEAEGPVHRPAEWSVTKSYPELIALLEAELGGYPDVSFPEEPDGLDTLLRRGAESAHQGYEVLIDHYDLTRGVKDPPAGLDRTCREIIARQLGAATVGFARVLDRATAEAAVTPPEVDLTLSSVLATVTVPFAYLAKKLHDAADRAQVRAIFDEVQRTGKVVESLPEDDRTVRRLHAAEVLRVPLTQLDAEKPRPAGTRHGQAAGKRPTPQPMAPVTAPALSAVAPTLRYFLQTDAPVSEAPSVGPKTAERLQRIGVRTVADLLALDSADAVRRLAASHITERVLRDWQDQARLACSIPEVRCHDVQLLVAAEIRTVAAVAGARPAELLAKVSVVAESAEGKRILRSSRPPDLEEVADWVRWAGHAA